MKLVFNMICLIEILKILAEEHLLINYFVIKHLILLETPNMMGINVDLLQWSLNYLINKTFGSGIRNENISNRELAKELYKPVIRKFKKRKVHSPFIDNI